MVAGLFSGWGRGASPINIVPWFVRVGPNVEPPQLQPGPLLPLGQPKCDRKCRAVAAPLDAGGARGAVDLSKQRILLSLTLLLPSARASGTIEPANQNNVVSALQIKGRSVIALQCSLPQEWLYFFLCGRAHTRPLRPPRQVSPPAAPPTGPSPRRRRPPPRPRRPPRGASGQYRVLSILIRALSKLTCAQGV
eukprot:1184507-Prorocentrum_minimum.AAC.2